METVSVDSAPAAGPRPEPSGKLAAQLLQNLPTMPEVSTKLIGMMGKASIDLRQVGQLIGSDPVLTAEVLRMANSPMFGLRQQARSILHAIAFLGLERTKSLACTVALRNFLCPALQVPMLKVCWRNSLAIAVLSEEMANWAQSDGAEAYTAGLMHDVGRMALMAISPARYIKILEEIAVSNKDPLALEEELFSITHTDAGKFLAAKWALPEALHQVMGLHHAPLTADPTSLLGIVHHAVRAVEFMGFPLVTRHNPAHIAAMNAAATEHPLQQFIDHIPANLRQKTQLDLPELTLLIAARVNAIES